MKFVPSYRPVTVLTVLFLIWFTSAILARAEPPPGYQLVWQDDFRGDTLDTNKWVDWHAGKRRDASNTADAVSVHDGDLCITTYTTNGVHHTGMIATAGKFEAGPGYYEARIKFGDTNGMWSAFWLQTPTMGRPLENPAVAGAEIDVCEHRWHDQNKVIAGKIQTNIHWDGYGAHAQSTSSGNYGDGLAQDYHTYGLLWTTTNYQFYVDGKLGYTTTNGLSLRPEFIILSSEVDDTSTKWAGPIPAEGYGGRDQSSVQMHVDYVRYYAPPATGQ